MLNKKTYALMCAILLMCFGLAVAQEQPSEEPSDQQAPSLEDIIAKEQRPPVLMELARRAYGKQDYPTMELAAKRLVALRPYITDYRSLLARAYALQDKKSPAYNVLLELVNQGMSIETQGDKDFDAIRGTEVFDYMEKTFAEHRNPVGEASVAVEADRSNLLVDGIAYDASRDQFLIGSVTQGKVFAIGEDGKLETVVEASEDNGLLGVFDIATDNERNILWVASAAVAHYKDAKFQDVGSSAVHKFDLKSGKHLGSFEAPGGKPGHMLINLAVGPNGDLFVADSRSPNVYRMAHDADALELFFSAPFFQQIRGLAVGGDNKFLYFSDYEQGLFAVSLDDRKAVGISAGNAVNLGGIDDISWYDGTLLIVQNGNIPHRVLRLGLEDDGVTLKRSVPVASSLPEFDAPSTSLSHNGRFYLLAGNDWSKYNPQTGKPLEGAELSNPKILQVDVTKPWQESR